MSSKDTCTDSIITWCIRLELLTLSCTPETDTTWDTTADAYSGMSIEKLEIKVDDNGMGSVIMIY